MYQVNKMREELGKENDWVLLIVDGFAAHSYSVKALQNLFENKIKCIRMPSHTSSALQALDVSVFKPLKVAFRELVSAWTLENTSFTKYDLTRLFHKCWIKVINNNRGPITAADEVGQYAGRRNYLGRAGMKATGAYPLNMNWLETHSEAVKIADVALSTGVGSSNAEMVALAGDQDTTSLLGIETFTYAQKLLRHHKLSSVTMAIEKYTDLDSEGFMQVS
jgi:hypothetical protein